MRVGSICDALDRLSDQKAEGSLGAYEGIFITKQLEMRATYQRSAGVTNPGMRTRFQVWQKQTVDMLMSTQIQKQ